MTDPLTPAPSVEELNDSEYLLTMVNTVLSHVPEIGRHNERLRKIATRLAASHSQAPAVPGDFSPTDMAILRAALVAYSHDRHEDSTKRSRAYAMFQVLRQEAATQPPTPAATPPPADEFERGRQQGILQERALWELAAEGQAIEAVQAEPPKPVAWRYKSYMKDEPDYWVWGFTTGVEDLNDPRWEPLYAEPAAEPAKAMQFAGWFSEMPSAMSYRLWEQGGHEQQDGDVALYF